MTSQEQEEKYGLDDPNHPSEFARQKKERDPYGDVEVSHNEVDGIGGVGRTQRRLTARHVTFIGFGGGIGTGESSRMGLGYVADSGVVVG
jgi:amino acid permease